MSQCAKNASRVGGGEGVNGREREDASANSSRRRYSPDGGQASKSYTSGSGRSGGTVACGHGRRNVCVLENELWGWILELVR